MLLLRPAGLLFGCGENSMLRQPLKNYLQVPPRQPDVLLRDDKVRAHLCAACVLLWQGGMHARTVAMTCNTGAHHMLRAPLTRITCHVHPKHPCRWCAYSQGMKGAMKSGTSVRKVGPLKTVLGHHADGHTLKLKVMVRAGAAGLAWRLVAA